MVSFSPAVAHLWCKERDGLGANGLMLLVELRRPIATPPVVGEALDKVVGCGALNSAVEVRTEAGIAEDGHHADGSRRLDPPAAGVLRKQGKHLSSDFLVLEKDGAHPGHHGDGLVEWRGRALDCAAWARASKGKALLRTSTASPLNSTGLLCFLAVVFSLWILHDLETFVEGVLLF